MASYSSFTLASVKKNFGLVETVVSLFEDVEILPLSEQLKDLLERGLPIALCSASEKAKSEFIVVPILFELQKITRSPVTIYSGKKLEVDSDQGLTGECDFILSKGALSHTIQAPIVTIVEAKDNDVEKGLGQCVAQLVGAKLFNQRESVNVDTVFGCVTTGEIWQFLKLEGNLILMDKAPCYINEIGKILGILKKIVEN
jgi:hypothetical protein